MSKVLFNKRKPGSMYFPVTHEMLIAGTGDSRSTDAQNMRFEEITVQNALYTQKSHILLDQGVLSAMSAH